MQKRQNAAGADIIQPSCEKSQEVRISGFRVRFDTAAIAWHLSIQKLGGSPQRRPRRGRRGQCQQSPAACPAAAVPRRPGSEWHYDSDDQRRHRSRAGGVSSIAGPPAGPGAPHATFRRSRRLSGVADRAGDHDRRRRGADRGGSLLLSLSQPRRRQPGLPGWLGGRASESSQTASEYSAGAAAGAAGARFKFRRTTLPLAAMAAAAASSLSVGVSRRLVTRDSVSGRGAGPGSVLLSWSRWPGAAGAAAGPPAAARRGCHGVMARSVTSTVTADGPVTVTAR